MLRSLDPDNDFKPKSKSFRPNKREAENFSENEMEYVEFAEKNDEDLRVNRHIRQQAREAALRSMGQETGGRGAKAS